ncbi:MAG: hypothetical protein JXB46_04010 [Candidatus Eisenbacteria bacterium]|nr:hypothetical protein [Candidatus Eisenbacteria bacterium]
MKRSEHGRMTVGLAFPGNGPVVRPAVARPVPNRLAQRRWFDAEGVLSEARRWSRERGLDRDLVAYWFSLLVCCSLFGLFVGGYVGFVEAATPAVDAPGSFAQLATSDVQWVAMVRQSGSMPGVRQEPATERRGMPGTQRRAKWLSRLGGQLATADAAPSTHGFVRLDRSATAGE